VLLDLDPRDVKKGGAIRQDREHPLYHLDAETLLVATYIWVDDELKTLGVSKRLCTGGIPLLKHLL
jgi:hypothetical protein